MLILSEKGKIKACKIDFTFAIIVSLSNPLSSKYPPELKLNFMLILINQYELFNLINRN